MKALTTYENKSKKYSKFKEIKVAVKILQQLLFFNYLGIHPLLCESHLQLE